MSNEHERTDTAASAGAGAPASDTPVHRAYELVEEMKADADEWRGCAPLWYGWALRQMYLMGYRDGLHSRKGPDEQ